MNAKRSDRGGKKTQNGLLILTLTITNGYFYCFSWFFFRLSYCSFDFDLYFELQNRKNSSNFVAIEVIASFSSFEMTRIAKWYRLPIAGTYDGVHYVAWSAIDSFVGMLPCSRPI